MKESKFIDIQDASDETGISRANFYKIIERGHLTHMRLARKIYIDRESLSRYINNKTKYGTNC